MGNRAEASSALAGLLFLGGNQLTRWRARRAFSLVLVKAMLFHLRMVRHCCVALLVLLAVESGVNADDYLEDPFQQLGSALPYPNAQRLASGAPGRDYWQQRADYEIEVTLDDLKREIVGAETIHYFNRSPDSLRYLWLQLDNNVFEPTSIGALSAKAPEFKDMPYRTLNRMLQQETFHGGVNVTRVADAEGDAMKHTVVGTMMRVELDEPLAEGDSIEFAVEWNYKINDWKVFGGRTGYEHFEEDDNCIYEIAHWYPRMAAYTDYEGWQNKQFIGSGEFTLEMGNFEVRINVPEDFIVSATGELGNADAVLTRTQRERLDEARSAESPVFIVTPEEAIANQAEKSSGTKTWAFRAENVRDFAFAASRKFIWDAWGRENGGETVMAMSFYPNEAEPLWSFYSTQSVAHTLEVYSKFTFPYPYPVAISVKGPVPGMEYPMICFNGPRPREDGTYFGKSGKNWKHSKYALVSVIIHEVGHNYFPMIVNSDERQWTWMDEGLNTFLQFLSEQEWEEKYPSGRGHAKSITGYMTSGRQRPIMSNSETIFQFGSNAYAKPATALNILRETILGRELFDYAFREYSRLWMFKRPEPADFFRVMEDASGVDLDWFWRGWFFTTHHCDISIDSVRRYSLNTGDPVVDKARDRRERDEEPEPVTETRNRDIVKRVDVFHELKDFYNDYDELDVTDEDRESFEELLETLDDHEEDLLKTERAFYVVDFKNVGGLVMPILLDIEYENGSHEEMRIPAEIWRYDPRKVKKLILTDRPIRRIVVDPLLETADTDVENNYFPRRIEEERFDLKKNETPKNPMQKAGLGDGDSEEGEDEGEDENSDDPDED
jgi:hypothetical protein